MEWDVATSWQLRCLCGNCGVYIAVTGYMWRLVEGKCHVAFSRDCFTWRCDRDITFFIITVPSSSIEVVNRQEHLILYWRMEVVVFSTFKMKVLSWLYKYSCCIWWWHIDVLHNRFIIVFEGFHGEGRCERGFAGSRVHHVFFLERVMVAWVGPYSGPPSLSQEGIHGRNRKLSHFGVIIV